MKRLFLCCIISTILLQVSAQEISITEIETENTAATSGTRARLQLRWGISYLGQGTPTTGSSANGISSSQIIHQVGIGMQISFVPLLGIAPSVDLYTDEYIYLESYKRAFPTQTQTGSSLGPLATVLALGVNVPWYISLPIGDMARFDLATGVGFVFRIPVAALDGSENIAPIGEYILENGRWVHFYLETGFGFRLVEWFGFSVAAKALLPIWHIWDTQGLPFHDHLMLGLVVGLEFHF